MNRLLNRLSRSGSAFALSFSSQEMLHDCIIGLDGIHRKLLVLRGTNKGKLNTETIDLDAVKTCSIKKYFGKIGAGGLRNRKLDQYLQRITLNFEFRNGDDTEIIFYDHSEGKNIEVKKIEQKARHWETMLSKMLNANNRKIA